MALFVLTVEITSRVRIVVEAEGISKAIEEIERGGYHERDLSKFRQIGETQHRTTAVNEAKRLSAAELEGLAEDEREAQREAKAAARRKHHRSKPKGDQDGDSDEAAS
ncbi:MAG TPA: hypothetical protein VHY20_04705 [Pirellulales bacterium]|jgi:hypothetical protein|nr:hypothetical protein [Pirellulales bacterium]